MKVAGLWTKWVGFSKDWREILLSPFVRAGRRDVITRKLFLTSLLLSALEILDRMTTADFMRRAKAADFHSRAWSVLFSARDSSDRVSPDIPHMCRPDKVLQVLEACLLFFCALVSRETQDAEDLSSTSSTFMLFILEALELDPTTDILTLISSTMPSKPNRGVISNERPAASLCSTSCIHILREHTGSETPENSR